MVPCAPRRPLRYPGTFLYNIGPITSINDPDLSVRQTWTLWERQKDDDRPKIIGSGITAPNNVGKKSFPEGYDKAVAQAITTLKQRRQGVRRPAEDPFAIDVGRIFDLLAVGGPGTDNLDGRQRPLDRLADPARSDPQVGRAARHRRVDHGRPSKGTLPFYYDSKGDKNYASSKTKGKKHNGSNDSGHWVQVERLGQPLVNEVIIPRGLKDYWNTVGPDQDYRFEKYYLNMNKPGQFVERPQQRGAEASADRRPRRSAGATAPLASRRRPGAPTCRRSCCAGSSTRTPARRPST